MDAASPRWRQVTTSRYAWEADALNTLRDLLPDTAPVQVWTNFQFTDGGRIHEVDALVITAKGGFVVEIKSWSGAVTGDQGTWTQIRRDGSRVSYPNPANLANEKAKALAGLVKASWPPNPHGDRPDTIFLRPLVWFSNPDLDVGLHERFRPHVALADGTDHRTFATITDALLTIGSDEDADPRFRRVREEQSERFVKAMRRIGIRESERRRTAGSYVLDLPAFAERGSTQDFTATHQHTNRRARVRIFSNVAGQGPDQARALKDAAYREHTAAQNLRRVDGVIDAIDFDVTDFGPAVVFDHDRHWRRLDLFLAERDGPLPVPESLRLMEALAGTLREVHKHRITHRMLTPQSVWLKFRHGDGDPATAVPLLTDLSLAADETATVGTTTATHTRVGVLPAASGAAVEVVLGDPAIETFLAPEAFTDSHADGVALDVYSLGALTYLMITGRPPAADRSELRNTLGQHGLSLSAVLPEIDPQLEAVVRRCTTPIVADRYERMSDVAAALVVARAAVTGERLGAQVDPLLAEPGDVLADRFEVHRRLGQGSSASALWCRDRHLDRDVALKVSLGGPCDDRVRAEGERLVGLDQANIVKLHEVVELGGRPTLVLSFAGERSLADRLRADGAVSTEDLKRWGDDLLEAVRYLEKVGVWHRDIKPDNLGVVPLGPRKEQHLVLYDFSLSNARGSDTDAGTPPYLEPFLGGDRPFDLAAERYAAAVTIHEMATGETPTWGDGRSDPAFLPGDVEATLLIEAMDEALHEPLTAFLARALRRDPAERFDTAEDMLRAWNDVFTGWEAPPGDAGDAESGVAERAGAVTLPETLALDDPVTSFDVSKKVTSALRKCGAATVRDVGALDPARVNRTRGVSVKTRRHIIRLRAAVLERFADLLSTAGPSPHTTGEAQPSPASPRAAETPATPADLDTLGLRLVPPRGARGPAGKVAETVRALLGLDLVPDPPTGPVDWPTVGTVASAVDLSPAAVSRTHRQAREHWGSHPDLVAVVADVVGVLVDLGGVAGASELAGPLLDRRPTGLAAPDAHRLASAVVRAAIEATGNTVPEGMLALRRSGRRTLIAVDGAAIAERIGEGHPAVAGWEETATDWSAFDPEALLSLAVALGGRADDLVRDAVLVPSSEAVPALRSVRTAAGRRLSDSRLVRLAAAASGSAVANPASELVARTAGPVDALRWSRSALIGVSPLTPAALAERVAVRFPHVELPPRPALDDALTAAGLPYEWDHPENAYLSTAAPVGGERLTVGPGRAPTMVSTGGRTLAPADPLEPTVAAALAVEARLDASAAKGGFLALRVPTDRLHDARRSLSRWTSGEQALVEVDLEAAFLRHLRSSAEARRVRWEVVTAADDPASGPAWDNLSILSDAAVRATLDEVMGHRRVLAWFPGALVRYGWRLSPSPLDQLRDAATTRDGALDLLWLVVLGGQADALPAVDGRPVPIVAPSEWLEVTDPWLSNVHRSAGDAGVGGRSA